MIKYSSSKQISIGEFIQPFGRLDAQNRWVVLSNLLPWDEMVGVYVKRLSLKMGRKAISPRVAIGALIIKHLLRLSDEETIQFIKENPYTQYFLGYAVYRYDQPFTASLFVSIRRRLGLEEFDTLMGQLMSQVERVERKSVAKKNAGKTGRHDDDQTGTPQGTTEQAQPASGDCAVENKGHLIVDATVCPSDIKYPTDLDLLNEAREKSEKLIDQLYEPGKDKIKPRTYRKKARQSYLICAKQRKKHRDALRKAIKAQLNYLGRNLKTVRKLLDEKDTGAFSLEHKDQRLIFIIQEVYRQQKQMYQSRSHQIADRIVSISQPHIRPMVRGKAGKEVEFGAKTSTSVVNGYSYLHRLSWDAYNEGGDLISQLEGYRKRFGFYPEWLSADSIYGSRENRSYMKERGIKYTGPALGRRCKDLTQEHKAQEKERKVKGRTRSQIEGQFGLGKRRYDLGLVKAKTQSTSESWIAIVYLVMNIAHFLRVIFCPFLTLSRFYDQRRFEMILDRLLDMTMPQTRFTELTF